MSVNAAKLYEQKGYRTIAKSFSAFQLVIRAGRLIVLPSPGSKFLWKTVSMYSRVRTQDAVRRVVTDVQRYIQCFCVEVETLAFGNSDHFTHGLANPPCMISSRNSIEHGFIPSLQSSSHCFSMARRTLSLRALSSSTIFSSVLAHKSGETWLRASFDSVPFCIISVLGEPASCMRLFSGRILRSAFGDKSPDGLDRCFLKGGL